ncbi:MAG: outer membrane beta-barrel protein [Bacteroidia bacterium]|nr:outer membrane beta-barrel protein [Bacteroidia bacterium]
MKTKILLTLLTVFLAASIVNAEPPGRRGSHSHRKWSNGFIGVSVGGGMPMSDYGKSDTIEGSGYAKIGIHFNGTIGYKVMPFLGVMAMAGGTLNGFNADAYGKQFLDTASIKTSWSSKSYLIGNYLAGAFVYFSDGQSYDIMVRILAGLATVKFPIITSESSSSGWTQEKNIEVPSARGLGYDVGVGINYKLAGKIGLLVNVDYLGTVVKYADRTESTEVKFVNGIVANSTYLDTKKYAQPVGLINFTVGVAINL